MATLHPLAEASDPTTPPQRLRRLARHRDRAVREAVAGNPNIDSIAIRMIGAAHPEALARNPLVSWLVVEDADFLRSWPDTVRQRVLMAADEGLLWWAARYGTGEDRYALLANPKAPTALIEHLAAHDGSWTATLAQSHVCSPVSPPGPPSPIDAPDDVDELFLLGLMPEWLLEAAAASNDVRARRHAARDQRTPAASIRSLLIDADESVRSLASLHPRADARDLAVTGGTDAPLTDDDIRWLASTLAGTDILLTRASLNSSALLLLSESAVWQTRQAVAAHEGLTADIARRLMLDADADVKAALALNPRCPTEVRAVLYHDRDLRVREAATDEPTAEALALSLTLLNIDDDRAQLPLARHPLAPQIVLERLSRLPDWRVREAVAANRSTPAESLKRLSEDHDADVRAAAAANSSLPAELVPVMLVDTSPRVRAALADVLTAPALLSSLAGDEDTAVRIAVARNPFTPDAALVQLAVAAPPEIAGALFARSALPAAAFDSLALTSDDALRVALWSDERTPRSALARLVGSDQLAATALDLRNGTPTDVPALVAAAPWLLGEAAARGALDEPALHELARSADWRLREAAARGATSGALLAQLAADSDYDVRVAVALNPASSRGTIQALSSDSSSAVRVAIATRPDAAPSLLARLLADDDEQVSRSALANPRLPGKARDEHVALSSGLPVTAKALARAVAGAPAQQAIAARHPLITRGQLDRLAHSDHWRVREAAARSPSLASATARSLLKDSDRDVRRALAENRAAPADVVDTLAVDSDDSVRRAALAHPALSAVTRARLQRRLVLRLARQGTGAALAAAAASPLLPRWFGRRRRFWQSTDWWVRYGVAANPNCEADLRNLLAQDGIVWVREAAQ